MKTYLLKMFTFYVMIYMTKYSVLVFDRCTNITTNQNPYICLYDDQVPRYLFIVESFSENNGAKQRQWDIKGSVGCLKHTDILQTQTWLVTYKNDLVLLFESRYKIYCMLRHNSSGSSYRNYSKRVVVTC